MSYANEHRHVGTDIDEVLRKAARVLSQAGPVLEAAEKLVEDPVLPEVVCQVLRLHRINSGQPAGEPCRELPLAPGDHRKGVGLYVARRPLRWFVWARENPTAAIAIGAGLVGSLIGLGYWTGRSARA